MDTASGRMDLASASEADTGADQWAGSASSSVVPLSGSKR